MLEVCYSPSFEVSVNMAEKERGGYEGVWVPLQRDYGSNEPAQLEASVNCLLMA